MFYIFNKEKTCIAISDNEPNNEDLERRGEKAYESSAVISLDEAVLDNCKVLRKELVPQVVTPALNQDVADLYQAMFDMSARLEKMEGGK